MSNRQRKIRLIQLAQKLVSYCVILGIALSSIPLPYLVSPKFFKDLSVPFICQDHACGCCSASQCWSNCRCFSHGQRIAWAHAHGVEVPATHRSTGHNAKQQKGLLHEPDCGAQSSLAKVRRKNLTRSTVLNDEFCGHRPAPEKTVAEPPPSKEHVAISSPLFRCHSGKSYFLGGIPWCILGEETNKNGPAKGGFASIVVPSMSSIDDSPPIPPPKLRMATA